MVPDDLVALTATHPADPRGQSARGISEGLEAISQTASQPPACTVQKASHHSETPSAQRKDQYGSASSADSAVKGSWTAASMSGQTSLTGRERSTNEHRPGHSQQTAGSKEVQASKALRARKAFRTGGDQNCTSTLLPAVWARAAASECSTCTSAHESEFLGKRRRRPVESLETAGQSIGYRLKIWPVSRSPPFRSFCFLLDDSATIDARQQETAAHDYPSPSRRGRGERRPRRRRRVLAGSRASARRAGSTGNRRRASRRPSLEVHRARARWPIHRRGGQQHASRGVPTSAQREAVSGRRPTAV